ELFGIVRRAVVAGPRPSDGELMEAEHVHHADLGQCSPKEVWSLCHARSYEQAAIGTSLDGKLGRRSVIVLLEPLCGGDEIVEHILLVLLGPREVPFFAVFAATAQHRLRVN